MIDLNVSCNNKAEYNNVYLITRERVHLLSFNTI